jgi:hypothetical protein
MGKIDIMFRSQNPEEKTMYNADATILKVYLIRNKVLWLGFNSNGIGEVKLWSVLSFVMDFLVLLRS